MAHNLELIPATVCDVDEYTYITIPSVARRHSVSTHNCSRDDTQYPSAFSL
jgi:hypothetical protein